MTFKNLCIVAIMAAITSSASAIAATAESVMDNGCGAQLSVYPPSQTLPCYLDIIDSSLDIALDRTSTDPETHVHLLEFQFSSQYWPKSIEVPYHLRHHLDIYTPQITKDNTALLFIEGGIRLPSDTYIPGGDTYFFNLAKETQTTIVRLSDVPYQNLVFSDGQIRSEDNLIAYTFNQYLNSTQSNQYWPLLLPMTKTVVKAMDAVKTISEQRFDVAVDDYILVGYSKRAWTAWLTALVDERVKGFLAIVYDNLNFITSAHAAKNFYDGKFPDALVDYIRSGVIARLGSPEAKRLEKVVDPYQYINCATAYCDFYRHRLEHIPKSIINASGDELFAPTSSKNYYTGIPGPKRLRYIANSGHFLMDKVVANAIKEFRETTFKQSQFSALHWQNEEEGITVNFNPKPEKIRLWQAYNPKQRDFRFGQKTSPVYEATDLSDQCANDNCTLLIPNPEKDSGFSAFFVEAEYKTPEGNKHIETTNIRVVDHKPSNEPSPDGTP